MKNQNRTEPLPNAGLKALTQAARDAVELGKRTGTPVWVWRHDQWVNLLAEPTVSYREAETDEIKKAPLVREPPAEEE
jgi:hypothetical protein